MKCGVLGTGIVGQTLATKLADLSHEVMIGTRDVARTMARTEPEAYGHLPFCTWKEQQPHVQIGTFAQAAAFGELVVNTTAGSNSLEALKMIDPASLSGKILIDVANPLDFSHGMLPSLSVVNTDSLGEQIQRAFPQAKVVKTLNTMHTTLMVNPTWLANGEHDVFLCGNDPEARAQVKDLLINGFGWRDVIDLGDITAARGLEMLLPLWLRLWDTLQTPLFNFKIVR